MSAPGPYSPAAGSPKPPPEENRPQAYGESQANLTLLDPPRWGWTAAGGVSDLLTPHERARRSAAKRSFLANKRRREHVSTEEGRTTSQTVGKSDREGNVKKPGENSEQSVSEQAIGSMLEPGASAAVQVWPDNGDTPSTQQLARLPARKKRLRAAPQSLDMNPRRFSAVACRDNPVLDIYTYHRGREGVELRDEETAELLCDVPPTDTNHSKDEPKMMAHVLVKFLLEATPVEGEPRWYRETISWDLQDPETPTPALFAAGIAVNYGLDYLQTMELTESIQNQLRAFVRENSGYAEAVPLQDYCGNPREAPSAHAHSLYGGVCGLLPGGIAMAGGTGRQRCITRAATVTRSSVTEKGGPASKAPTKRRRETLADGTHVEARFREEVQKRLREESIQRIKSSRQEGQLLGEIAILNGERCHVCRSKKLCGGFACGIKGHALCDGHFSAQCGLSMTDDHVPLLLEYCPLCSLACSCPRCSRALDVTAGHLKRQQLDEDFPVSGIEFVGLFEQAAEIFNEANSDDKPSAFTRKPPSKKRHPQFEQVRSVEKVPVGDFPKEVREGVDIDPVSEIAYRTIYLPESTTILDVADRPSEERSSPVESVLGDVMEDGSIEFCMKCRLFGNLICCDFCPRAFHVHCAGVEREDDSKESAWKCPDCRKEEVGLPEMEMDGSKSLVVIASVYGGKDSEGVKTLSIIHEMLIRLMDYAFGYVFREPVNLKQVPAYKKVVKTPMDLGTIETKLKGGSYECLDASDWLGPVIAAVLKDIELVWHNCYTFNYPGSAIYRMAEVQERCASRILEMCVYPRLPDVLKNDVSLFKHNCVADRKKIVFSGGGGGARLVASGVVKAKTGQGSSKFRNKISVSSKANSVPRKSIAVLDPDTGRVVKIFTRMQSACTAVEFFLSRKVPCEWDWNLNTSYAKLRRIVEESAKNTAHRLFGYRWVSLDDLYGGRVVLTWHKMGEVAETAPHELVTGDGDSGGHLLESNIVEMVLEGQSLCFNSVEEAISCLGTDSDRVSARVQLENLPPNGEFIQFLGRKWRCIRPPSKGQNDEISGQPGTSGEGISAVNTGGTNGAKGGVARFIKQELASGKKLASFSCLERAFEDWLETFKTSNDSHEECRDLSTFQTEYIDGGRSVYGFTWRSLAPQESPVSVTENSKREDCNGGIVDTETTERRSLGEAPQASRWPQSRGMAKESKIVDLANENGTSTFLHTVTESKSIGERAL